MGSADHFDSAGTLGIEEEYYVVDSDGRPTSGTDELVHDGTAPKPLAGRLDHELFKCVIEAQTPTLDGIADARTALGDMRSALIEYADSHGYGIAAAGLHPAARWRELEHAEKPRYRAQLDRIQYPQHRNTTAGLHIHVGVDDAGTAAWVANECRWFLPIVLALSANSPFWNGFDTGLASARARIFEALPTTGVPTAFDSYADFERLERTLLETNSIEDRGEVWWDVRPHSALGTVEVRVPDAQADPDRVLALVEYVHALVEDRMAAFEAATDPWAAYRSGGTGPDPIGADPTAESQEAGTQSAVAWLGVDDGRGRGLVGPVRHEVLVENKWRALRYGHDASFITPRGGLVTLETVVEREGDRLGVDGIREYLSLESGAVAQRRLREQAGPQALFASLALEA